MRKQTLERILRVLLDVMSLFSAWYLTAGLQSYMLPSLGFTRWAQAPENAPPVLHVTVLWLLMVLWVGVYREYELEDTWEVLSKAFHASIALGCAVIIASFFSTNAGTPHSRSFALIVAPLSLVLFRLSRLGAQTAASAMWRHWRSEGSVAVLGCDQEAVSVLEHLRLSEKKAVRGLIVPADRSFAGSIGAGPILGTTDRLAEVINREGLDQIVMLNGTLTERELETCSEISARMGVTMSCAVAFASPVRSLNYSVHLGIPLLEILPVSFTAAERLVKRGLDIAGSASLLIVIAPVMAFIAFLVKATSEGPILFTAQRVGRGGRYFTFLKFRTMYVRTARKDVAIRNEKEGHLFKIKDDPRITPIGKFLRRYSLDELPQLINVLLGDMSLVGPRPLPIEDMDPDGMSQRFAIWSEQRASVPPGITGLWQVRGRSELPFSDLIKYDLEYVHNWSLGLDLKILLATPRFVLTGKGAY